MSHKNKTLLHAPRVLLIEEHPMFQKMTHAMLDILGVTCLSAHQSDEALEIFQKGCELVLLNLNLADPRNFELAKKMRAMESAVETHTPIIGHTAETDLETIEALSLEAKIDCAYPKIHNLQDLSFILSEWLPHPVAIPAK